MESSYNGCPTEILIDFKEDDFMPSCVNKQIRAPLQNQKTVKYLGNKGFDLFEIKHDKYQCIMDMSPIRLKKECSEPVVNSVTNSKQALDTAVDDCPTAVLIEVPNSLRICPEQYSLNCNKSDCDQEDTVLKCKSFIQDVKEEGYNCFGEKKFSAIEDSDNPFGFAGMKNERSPPRCHWKTPSPQSMSRISKEASKIVHNLNSSTLLDEDSLLCEEILPIPIDFDNFDLDENADQETLIPKTENSDADTLSIPKSSVSIQTQYEDIHTEFIEKGVSDSSNSVIKTDCISPKYQNSSTQSPSDPFDSEINLKSREDSNEFNITSGELKSSEVQSDSIDNSENLSCEEIDVFIESSLPSEDKENIQQREDKIILPSKTLNNYEATQKHSLSQNKMENRPTLRNLSNVKRTVDSRYLPSTNKLNSTSHLKQNPKPNSKELQHCGKQQLKKTTSAEPQMSRNGISRSNSFHYDSTRESISSFQKPKAPSFSEYKSSSSDVKHAFTPMKTPSKRYSIATPLRSASVVKKTTFTPALSNFQNPSVPRFTPQSARGNRLSFSKSWQQPNMSNSKGLKKQSISTSSAVTKPSFSGIYSSKLNKQSLNLSISVIPSQISKNNSMSTTSKKRFSSKLNLPSSLLAEQDRKLARALFPNVPPK